MNVTPLRLSDLPVAFSLNTLLLLVTTVGASALGILAAFGFVSSTKAEWVDQVIGVAAVGGPYAIAAFFCVAGAVRVVSKKRSWHIPLLGIVCLALNFLVLQQLMPL